jgi:hypothetical protein
LRFLKQTGLALVVAAVVALSACGGGGGGKGSSNAGGGGNSGGGSASNGAPTISGQPATSIQEGQAYSFQPSAQDPDGDSLQFSVQNLPSWASFDAATGRISGTPTAAAVGTYSGISITVSDGARTAVLGPFAIEVVALGTGAATVSWTPPNTNTDGTALFNLSGYRVLYGRSEGDLSRSIAINNPSISTYVVENLTQGTWYFAVVAVNSQGTWSSLSNVAVKTIT